MKLENYFKEVLQEFNKQHISYCVLRNYEFLVNQSKEKGFDFDIVISKNDLPKAEKVFHQLNFLKSPKQFSLKHQGYGKYISKINKKIGFDVQKGGVYWNDMVYLEGDDLLSRKVKLPFGEDKDDFFNVLSKEDSLIMYVCHSLLGKRFFKEKYKNILINLIEENLDWFYINEKLSFVFTKSIVEKIVERIKNKQFKVLQSKSYFYIINYILKRPKNLLIFIALFFRWLKWLKLGKSYPMISFIGPDGSGKSSNAEELLKSIELFGKDVELIYTGRGKSNLIPIKKIGNIYKKIEEKKDSAEKDNNENNEKKKKTMFFYIKPLIYTLSAPIYTLDLFLRYWFVIYPKRKKKIIVTDRYCSDVLLMEHVPFVIKRMLLAVFPKPTITFYFYNDAEILYERRKQQSVEELNRQMKLFKYLVNKFKAIPIKTTNFEKDLTGIKQQVFNYLFIKNPVFKRR
jgi:thymidylate kinase